MARLVTGSSFTHLEERLADEIAAGKRDDPFLPMAVIVPTRALKPPPPIDPCTRLQPGKRPLLYLF